MNHKEKGKENLSDKRESDIEHNWKKLLKNGKKKYFARGIEEYEVSKCSYNNWSICSKELGRNKISRWKLKLSIVEIRKNTE